MTKSVKAYAVFLPELRQLLQAKDLATLKSVLREINPVDLAEGWKDFSREEQIALFQLLGTRRAVVVFEELEVEDQVFLLQAMGDEASGQMVSELPPGEVAHLFRKMPRRVVRRLANLVKRQEAMERLEKILSYPPRTAGALMHTEVVALKEAMTASQALELIRAVTRTHVHEAGLLSTLYVVNGQGRLVGLLPLQTLVAAPHDAKVEELMSSARAVQILATADQEEAARLVSRYNLFSAPVVEDGSRLVGVLLMDDVLDIIHQEASEDIAKMAGAHPEILTSRSLFRSTRLRFPWLVVTFGGQLLVAAVIRHFEGTLTRLIAMVSFMPLIAALGGNVGSQSATIVVRGLATGGVQGGNEGGVIRREMLTGILCGIFYGLVLSGIAYLMYGDRFHLAFAVSVGLSALVSMTVAATMGAAVPIAFRRFGVDPATASAPLITTTTDLLSVSVYFLLATFLLRFMG